MATMFFRSLDIDCSNCSTPWRIAKVRCLDCKEYLCDNCLTSHSTLKAMKDHHIIFMADIKAGKVNLKNEEKKRLCKRHGNLYEYYCDIEKRPVCKECIISNACPSRHRRINLKKASEIHSDDLKNLKDKTIGTLEKYNDAVLANDSTRQDLEIRSKKQYEVLENAERECVIKVRQVFEGFQSDLACTKKNITTELALSDADLQSSITGIKECIRKTEDLVQSKSEFEIVSAHSTLSRRLQNLSTGKPKAAPKHMLEFDVAIPTVKDQLEKNLKKTLRRQKWKLVGQFKTGDFDKLSGLSMDINDDIALSSLSEGLRVFSRNGYEKHTLYGFYGASGVAVNSGNRYFSISKSKKVIKIHEIYDDDMETIAFRDVNDQKSLVNSIAVDSNDRIIVGQVNNTISIHNAAGSVISKFATVSRPYHIAATSNGHIVGSFLDQNGLNRSTSVQIMDYCGGNVSVIKPPEAVNKWLPGFVCCGQGEIFVTNSGSKSKAIHSYTSEGEYLGCVTTEVPNPSATSLSRNGEELYVADFHDLHSCVKIFQRPSYQ